MKWILSIFLILGLWAGIASAQPDSLHVIWQREGTGPYSAYGYTVLPLGDQNDDSYDDWAVFALGNGGADPTYIEFFHGNNPLDTIPYMSINLDSLGLRVLYIETLGDLNGDGYRDWGLEYRNSENAYNIYSIYFGGPLADSQPDYIIPFERMTGAITPIGDFNGDGYADLMRTTATHDSLGPYYTAEIFFGGQPFDTLPDWQRHDGVYAHLVGDINGDGYSDFIERIGHAPETLLLYLGGQNPDTMPSYIWSVDDNSDNWSIVPDLNGDGFDDLVASEMEHAIIRYGSNPPNFHVDCLLDFPCGGPGWIFGAGDLNGDGYQDLAMTNPFVCGGCVGGFVTLHLGHPWINPPPVWSICGYWDYPLEETVAHIFRGIGDVNGDSLDDLILVGYSGDMNAQRGHVFIFAGDSTIHVDAEDPVILHPSAFILSVFPNPFNATTTISFTLPRAGEVKMTVYDVLGRNVGSKQPFASTKNFTSGEHYMTFDGSGLASGVYFVRVEAGETIAMRKMLLLK